VSRAVALLPAAAPDERGDGQLLGGWLGWLRERLDPQWRAGEWDPARLLFTGETRPARSRPAAGTPTGSGSA
jgi:hypothetical protein